MTPPPTAAVRTDRPARRDAGADGTTASDVEVPEADGSRTGVAP